MSRKISSDGVDEPADDEGREQPRDQDLEKNIPEQNDEKDEAFLVKFEEGESNNPRNWSNLYKGIITLQLGFLAYGEQPFNATRQC